MLGLAIVLGVLALAPSRGRAQFVDGTGDPFFLYYGFYLPNQAAQAEMQRYGVNSILNARAAANATRQLGPDLGREGVFSPFNANPNDVLANPFGERPRAMTRAGIDSYHFGFNGTPWTQPHARAYWSRHGGYWGRHPLSQIPMGQSRSPVARAPARC
jgi:hypothetical protein